MTEIAETLRVWIEQIILTMGYPGIALIMAVETIFPPIPSELVLPMAGFLAADGQLDFWGVVISGSLGSILGGVVLYGLGLYANETIIRRLVRQYGKFLFVEENDINRALSVFSRFGPAAVFFGRLVPLVRSLISIPAGMEKMSWATFTLYTTLGTVLWSIILTYAGRMLGQNWEQVLGLLSQYQKVVLAVIALAVIGFIVYKVRQSRSNSHNTAALPPKES